MTIWVDADGCPVIREIEQIAKQYAVSVVLLCDTNHELHSNTSEIIVIGAGADAVDFALVNRCQKGDIVVTQDYGVAAMALARGSAAIHQSGEWYTEDTIDGMLFQRHNSRKARRASGKHHLRGPKKTKKRRRYAFCKVVGAIDRNTKEEIKKDRKFLKCPQKVRQ
jgi:hypothetical protein